MSSSSYVRTTFVGPDADGTEKSQSTNIYLNPNLCGHVTTICIMCLHQWDGEHRINYDTIGGRKFLEKYPSARPNG